MKKYLALVPALALTVCLTACGGQNNTTNNTDNQQGSEVPATSTDVNAAKDKLSGRAHTGEVKYTVDGAEQSIAATLETTDDFSLYVPKENWDASQEDGKLTVASQDNNAVSVEITNAPSADAAALQAGLQNISADAFGEGEEITTTSGVSGTHFSGDVDGTHYSAYAFPNAGGAVLVVIQGPVEATGELAVLEGMVDSMVIA